MAPRRAAKPIDPPSDSESESGSDAPETVTLSTSKKQTKQRESELQQAEALRKRKDKARNRERDARLKARAERNREADGAKSVKEKGNKASKGKEKEAQSDDEEEDMDDGDEETAALRARMERAMQDAQGESGEEDDSDDGDENEDGPTFADLDGASSGIEEGNEAEEESNEEDEDEDDGPTFPDFDDGFDGSEVADSEAEDDYDEDTHSLPPAKPKSRLSAKANTRSQESITKKAPMATSQTKNRSTASASYLPDEVFAAAFASQAEAKDTSKRKAKDAEIANDKPAAKKKRKNTDKPHDVVIGSSRAIRVLPNTRVNPTTGAAPPPPPPATLPSRKVKKFMDRTLALKGGKQPSKTWERRAANIGVARRSYGPAYNFVRNP